MTKVQEVGSGLVLNAIVAFGAALFFHILGVKKIGVFVISCGIYTLCAVTVFVFPSKARLMALTLKCIGYSVLVCFALAGAMPFLERDGRSWLYAVMYFCFLLPLLFFLVYWLFIEPSHELDSAAVVGRNSLRRGIGGTENQRDKDRSLTLDKEQEKHGERTEE